MINTNANSRNDDGFVWNPNTFECECHKSCDFVEYLHYISCKCRKQLINKLGENAMKILI